MDGLDEGDADGVLSAVAHEGEDVVVQLVKGQ